jgi:hypothetical protein
LLPVYPATSANRTVTLAPARWDPQLKPHACSNDKPPLRPESFRRNIGTSSSPPALRRALTAPRLDSMMSAWGSAMIKTRAPFGLIHDSVPCPAVRRTRFRPNASFAFGVDIGAALCSVPLLPPPRYVDAANSRRARTSHIRRVSNLFRIVLAGARRTLPS